MQSPITLKGQALEEVKVVLLPGKQSWTRWQGGRRSGSEAGKGRDCIPDVENESFQKPQSKKLNYVPSEPW